MNNTVNQLIKNSSWLSGNITPISWYQYIRTTPTKTKPTGSPDAIAVSILSDIMYWYRPTEIRDEATGEVIGYKEKFTADKLQKSYQSYSNLFGVSKKKIKQSFDLLVTLGLITREFRTVDFESGLKLSNVMFIEPIIKNVFKISTSCKDLDTPSPQKRGGGSHQKGGDKYKDYTKITNNDVLAPPLPESIVQEPDKNLSSSFSESELVSLLAGLMALVPEQHRKPSVEKTIERGLNAHGMDYVKIAVLYSVAGSNGNTTQFKAYLSKCIENNWHDGWKPDFNQEDIEKKKEAFLASRRNMPDDILKADAENGCQTSAQVLSERGI